MIQVQFQELYRNLHPVGLKWPLESPDVVEQYLVAEVLIVWIIWEDFCLIHNISEPFIGFELSPKEHVSTLSPMAIPGFLVEGLIFVQFSLNIPDFRTGVEGALYEFRLVVNDVI